MMENTIHGKKVIETLALSYGQLYLAPGEDMREKYNDIVLRGNEPEKKDLSHFLTSDGDTLEYAETPAGKVLCVTLENRSDFITFLRIIANRCAMAEIPDTQGASIIDGVINWKKINDHRDEFFASAKDGFSLPEWNAEFKRFTSDNKNFKDAVIVLSVGPYSNIPASKLQMTDEEWITLSHTVRKYHECTHFICRRMFPEKINAVWDELVADAVGIYAAFGRFDPSMEKIFLGIEDDRYIGGRLENYVDAETQQEKKDALDALSVRVSRVLEDFDGIISENKGADPFDMAVTLEKSMERLWKND